MASTERVAAYITGNHQLLQSRQREVDTKVRTGDAQRRWPRENPGGQRLTFRNDGGDLGSGQWRQRAYQHLGRQFTLAWQQVFTHQRHPGGAQFEFHQRLALFDHHQGLDRRGIVLDLL